MPSNPNQLLTKVLKANSIGVLDHSPQTHAIPMKFPLYQRGKNPIGVVMHNTSGLIRLENMAGDWATRKSPPPSHLAIDQGGRVAYFVRLEYADRATEHTNMHISIEFQAVANGDISLGQIRSAAVIYGFLHDVYGVPFAISTSRTTPGLAHHSLFVDASNPDGHANCPGAAIIARKAEIIKQAKTFAASIDLGDQPTGLWTVRVDREGAASWIWTYQFDASGVVTWRDPFNGKTGSGTWKIDGSTLRFKWKNSSTVETWDIPYQPRGTGRCQMEGDKVRPVHAARKTA